MDAMELAAAVARHGCKVCGKSFSCGRSLGGHMRSHLSLGEAAAAAEGETGDELRRVAENGGRSSSGAVGYGLRENPRKTRRLSDFADDDEEEKDGGDGVGDGEHKACRECGKLFASWRLLLGHMRSHASCGRDRDEEEDEDVDDGSVPEEAETAAQAPSPVTVLPPAPRRRRRSMRVAAPPPVLSEFDKEQEDVARCLLMLSQDTSLWSLPVAKEEPFEKADERKKKAAKQPPFRRKCYDESALLQYGEAKTKTGGGSGVARGRKRSAPTKQQCEVAVATKRTRYECPGCGKVFSSYQALGGHRASHKRINTSCSTPKVAAAAAEAAASHAPEPSAETYTSFSTLSPSASRDSVAVGIDKAEAGFLDLNFPPAPPEEA